MSRSSTSIDPIHPGEAPKRDFMVPLRLSADTLARHIGAPPNRVSAIAAGRRGGAGGAEFWLNLQKRRELETARDAAGELAITLVAAPEAQGG